MKIKKYTPLMKSLLLIFAVISLFLFSKNANAESYKASLKKAIELDRDGFFEESIDYWEKSRIGSPSNVKLFSGLKISGT